MKKLLIALATGFIGFTNLNAQEKEAIGGFEKEDFFITGRLSYSNSSISDSDVSSNTFTFAPAAGYFITENLALQLGLSYNSSNVDNGVTQADASTFGVGAGVNYFFTPANRFSFTVGGSIFYNNTSVDDNITPDTNAFGVVVTPGINYFISNSFALNATVGALGFNSSSPDVDNARSTNTFVFNMDLTTVAFGLTYKF
ncbi:outer membrane beta-barrel protein [uncultured Tenacibaculum sp.]|uniref:outer membrane beta-barrel protein n=1 Tax=uncultured Tenacibaculum sp. TaxID=174713 RepID=UPI00261708E4|nr:outer membrane beta-barrel protein [uncultured Tenacibaculum sp.]